MCLTQKACAAILRVDPSPAFIMFKRTRRAAANTTRKTVNYGKKVVSYDELRSNWDMIGSLAKRLRPGRVGQAREETFANAYQRLNMNEQDLAQSHKYYSVRFYIFLAIGAVDFAMLARFAMDGNWIPAWLCLLFLAICLASCFQASFRAFQIEQRELFDVRYWLQHPQRWIPGTFQPQQPPRETGKRGELRVVDGGRKVSRNK